MNGRRRMTMDVRDMHWRTSECSYERRFRIGWQNVVNATESIRSVRIFFRLAWRYFTRIFMFSKRVYFVFCDIYTLFYCCSPGFMLHSAVSNSTAV